MGKEVAILVLLGALYLRICYTSTLNTSTLDEYSLLAIKKLINSDVLAKNWSEQTSFCTWIGVTCSQRHVRVTSLDLSSINLRGTVAREIGNLSFLTTLNISNNALSGSIPAEIGKLRRLRVLDMSVNQLKDRTPGSLGLLRRLEWLSLGNNYLSGDIPASLSACFRLSSLDLSYNNLTGSIPVSFGNLSQLQKLMLRHNQLTGELTSTIFNVSSLVHLNVAENSLSGSIPKHICSSGTAKLEDLRLNSNQFKGEIPSALMHCHSLERLYLGFNELEGSIPTDFWNLSKIRHVGLVNNKLWGRIPSLTGNLSNLEIFRIGYNRFEGTVPQEMGKLSRLIQLGLATNKLSGEVPQSVFNLSRLEELWLGFNNLSGEIPASVDTSFPNMKYFDLAQNSFHGGIPSSVTNLSGLIFLQVGGNSLSGDIPTRLGNLHQLQWLDLNDNQLTNNVSKPEQDFLSSLANCKHLTMLVVSHNPITGVLPKSLGSSNLSESLKSFYAGSCRIVSPLPNELGNLSSLLVLSLEDNDLTGLVPTALGHLNSLQSLSIQGNKLEGSISNVLCSLRKLYSVDFSENYLSGRIPGCLGDLLVLRKINLAKNAFCSSIPSSLWLSVRLEKMNMSYNLIDGSFPQEVGNMKSMIELDLSGNQLSGEVPDTISELQNLVILSLSNNRLNGPLSDSFSSLKGLEHLDLSFNNLSGPIPKSLDVLTFLSYFNVSFNKLSGEIPGIGAFENFTSDSFLGNQGLCGAPRFKVEECGRNEPGSSRKTKILKFTLPAISSLLVAAFVLFLVMRRRCVNSSYSPQVELSPVFEHERISYYEILHATNNLDEDNLIGRGSSGSVYKGCFSDKMVAAVKVFDHDVNGASMNFESECYIMCNIRHRNLVKVITSCSNLDFKALLMAFMPNGNLDKWLYSAGCSLDIFQTLEIMVDVATALEYLHEGCSFPVVHCDLKPQNILLDENMVAHVSDFGIAKLLTKEQRMHQTATLGTIGYMAPEYGSEGLVSTTVDVYSYGVLLMEMCSRRKPIDEMFSGELTMRKWMQESFPDSLLQVVDNELLNTDDRRIRVKHEKCLMSVIELAQECTKDTPRERPSAKNVLARIKKVELELANRN